MCVNWHWESLASRCLQNQLEELGIFYLDLKESVLHASINMTDCVVKFIIRTAIFKYFLVIYRILLKLMLIWLKTLRIIWLVRRMSWVVLLLIVRLWLLIKRQSSCCLFRFYQQDLVKQLKLIRLRYMLICLLLIFCILMNRSLIFHWSNEDNIWQNCNRFFHLIYLELVNILKLMILKRLMSF